jgi:hypothetical protein
MTLERGCSPSSVPPSPRSEHSCFSTLSSSLRRSDVSLFIAVPRLQADEKVSTKVVISPSLLKCPLDYSSSLRPPFSLFARLSQFSNKTHIKNQNRSSQSFHHITSPLFVFASCHWSLRYSTDYCRWVVYMIYKECRDVTSANMFFELQHMTPCSYMLFLLSHSLPPLTSIGDLSFLGPLELLPLVPLIHFAPSVLVSCLFIRLLSLCLCLCFSSFF